MDLHAGIHSADLVHGVFTLSPAAVAVWRFIPTTFFRVPAEAESFQALLVGLGVTSEPHKAPYDLNLYAVQLQELGDQPEILPAFPAFPFRRSRRPY